MPVSFRDRAKPPVRPLRIVVSTPTFLPVIGGAELGVHEIYRRVGHHHDVTVVTPRRPHDDAGRHVDDYGDAPYRVIHPLASVERYLPRLLVRVLHRTSLSYAATLIRLRLTSRADIFNFHYVEPHGPALVLLRWLLRAPTVLSLVGRSDVIAQLNPARRLLARAVIASAGAVLPNSTFYLAGTSIKSFEMVPYGVDTSEFTPARRDLTLRSSIGARDSTFVLLAVQRLASIKRVDVLLRVCAALVARGEEARLVVVGEGEDGAPLRSLATSLDIRDHVHFAGYVSSAALPTYFASADTFVFHSMFETFGVVFAQAMASGLPIVAADTSCVSGVIAADNGYLITPFDTEAFCDVLVGLKNDPELRRAMGMRNRKRTETEFDWDHIAARYEAVLLDVAERSGR